MNDIFPGGTIATTLPRCDMVLATLEEDLNRRVNRKSTLPGPAIHHLYNPMGMFLLHIESVNYLKLEYL